MMARCRGKNPIPPRGRNTTPGKLLGEMWKVVRGSCLVEVATPPPNSSGRRSAEFVSL